jgi:hypothetical protein
LRAEVSEDEGQAGEIVVDVVPQADEKSYKVQSVKSGARGIDGSGSGRANERKRRTSRKKN